MSATVYDLASLIARMEGYGKGGTIADLNNNPGNLRNVGQPGVIGSNKGFATFATPEDGWNALYRQINIDSNNGLTLREFIYKYAPPSENDTVSYLGWLSGGLGIGADDKLSVLSGREEVSNNVDLYMGEFGDTNSLFTSTMDNQGTDPIVAGIIGLTVIGVIKYVL